MSKDGKKERKVTTMIKTIDIVKLGKGFYVTTRINGRAREREYCKTAREKEARVKALKAEGYTLA